MGQILLRGVVWVDEVSVHKKLEKRAEIDENKPQSGGNTALPRLKSHRLTIAMQTNCCADFGIATFVTFELQVSEGRKRA